MQKEITVAKDLKVALKTAKAIIQLIIEKSS
jgi:hypothetical protein